MENIQWSGGNDYSIGRLNGRAVLHVQRKGPMWHASNVDGKVFSVASASTLRETQRRAEEWFARERAADQLLFG
jgi:hypothetical protein